MLSDTIQLKKVCAWGRHIVATVANLEPTFLAI